MESNLELLLRNNSILSSIMEYIGSIKFCIFTFSLLFKQLDGVYGNILITEKMKDIFIHHIYKYLYIDFFKPISQSQNSIDKLHKIISSMGSVNAANLPNAANAINCEELSILYAKETVSYLTTSHSDNHWFMQTIEEYYYIGGIFINEALLFGLSEDDENLNWYPIHNILLSQLDKKIYRFHIDGLTISHLYEDTRVLDTFYSDELCKVLNIVNIPDGHVPVEFEYIAETYEYDNKVMFWAILSLIFTVCTDYKKNSEKVTIIIKKCINVLYNRYFNNTMLLTYNIKIFTICSNYLFIKRRFNGLLSFFKYFNNKYPNMVVDLDGDLNECCSLDVL